MPNPSPMPISALTRRPARLASSMRPWIGGANTWAMICATIGGLMCMGNADAAGYCAYNKARQQSVSIGSDKNSLTLSAGSHFCCKANDALCGNTSGGNNSSGGVRWKIEASISGRTAWCGDPAKRAAGIALTFADSYLLIRDSRDPAPSSTASVPPPPPASSAPSVLRAPLSVDVMSADGKVLATLSCQYTG